MVDRFQQQDLASAQVGLPREDKAMSTAAAIVASAANAQRDMAMQEAAQQFAQAQQGFGQATQSAAYLASALEQGRKVERERLLQEKIAAARYGASTALREASDALKTEFAGNPKAGYEAAKSKVDAVLSGFVPQDVGAVEQARYRQHLVVEKAQFLEGFSGWYHEQEKKNSDQRFTLSVAQSTQEMESATTAQEFLASQDRFVQFAQTAAHTPERLFNTQEALAKSAKNFVNGIAETNPGEIASAIDAAKPFLSTEEIGKAQSTAKRRTKEIADEALQAEKTQNEFHQNVLEGKLTSVVKGALQQANTAAPGAKDVSLLRRAGSEVAKLGSAFDGQLKALEAQIKADPKNTVLIARHESVVKQKKQVMAAVAQLNDKADSAAQVIRHQQEMAARRAEAESHRAFVQSLAAARFADQAEAAKARAEVELELATLKESGSAEKLAEFSKAKLAEATKLRGDLEAASAQLDKNPQDKMAAQRVKSLSGRLSALSKASLSADNAADTVMRKNSASEVEKSKAAAKLYQTAGVPLYTTLLQRAKTPFSVHTEKGRVKIEGVSLNDARKRLDQLDSALADMSQSGLLSKEQMQTVKNTIEGQRTKLNTWAEQDGWGAAMSAAPWVHDAYNQPIAALEKRGLALPGTPQHKKTVDLYKANLDAIQARIYSRYENPKEALAELQRDAQALADKAMQATLEGKQFKSE
jgi:hypothetical protein